MPMMRKTYYGIFNLNTRMLASFDGWTMHPFKAMVFESAEMAEKTAASARQEVQSRGHLVTVVELSVSVSQHQRKGGGE